MRMLQKNQICQKNMKKVNQWLKIMQDKNNRIKSLVCIGIILGEKGENGKEKEKTEMSNALSEAIVKDKPNVKWTDIAGLE